MTDLSSLIQRLEDAKDGSRGLDAKIGLQTGRFFLAEPRYPGADRMYGYVDADGNRVEPGNGGQHALIPHYTTSLDAAMTLVSGVWRIRQMNFSGPCADDRKWHLNLHGGEAGEDTFIGRGDTPALALTIAALRARSPESK